MTTPRDLWLKTHIYQEGPYLKAVTTMAAAGHPQVFTSSVDLRPIAKAVVAYHKRLHAQGKIAVSGDCVGCEDTIGGCVGCEEEIIAGFFSSIGKVIKKVGRSKLLKSVSRAAKSVVRSKVTGAIAGGLAVAFPPVGAPAAAAYVAANATLAAVEQAEKAHKTIKKAVTVKRKAKAIKIDSKKAKANIRARLQVDMARKAKSKGLVRRHGAGKVSLAIRKASNRAASKVTKKMVANEVRRNPRAQRVVKQIAAANLKLRLARRNAPALRRAEIRRNKAKKAISRIIATARYSPDPAKKFEAQKAARIMTIVAQGRSNMAKLGKPLDKTAATGLVIDSRGRIIKGKFVRAAAQRGATQQVILAAQGKTQPGYFQRVAGCIGCW